MDKNKWITLQKSFHTLKFNEIECKVKNWAVHGYDVLEINFFTAVDLTVFGDSCYLVLLIDHASRKIVNWEAYRFDKHPTTIDIIDFYEDTISKIEIFAPIRVIHSDLGKIFQGKVIKDLLNNNQIINSRCVSKGLSNQVCERTNRTIKDMFRTHFLGPKWKKLESYIAYKAALSQKKKGISWDDDPLFQKKNNMTFTQIKNIIKSLIEEFNDKPHGAFRTLTWNKKRSSVTPNLMYQALARMRLSQSFYEEADSRMAFIQFNLEDALHYLPTSEEHFQENTSVGGKPRLPPRLRGNKDAQNVQKRLKDIRGQVHIPEIVLLPEVKHLLGPGIKGKSLEEKSEFFDHIRQLEAYYDKVESFRDAQQKVIDNLSESLIGSAESPFEKNLAKFLVTTAGNSIKQTENTQCVLYSVHALMKDMADIVFNQYLLEAQRELEKKIAKDKKMKRIKGKGLLGQADTINYEEFAWVMARLTPRNNTYRSITANSRRRLVLFVLYCTGCRISDVCQLTVQNIKELYRPGGLGWTNTSIQKTQLPRIYLVATKEHQSLFRSEFNTDFEHLIQYRIPGTKGKDGEYKFQERRPNDFLFLDLGLEGQEVYDKDSTFTQNQIAIIKKRTANITRDLNGAPEKREDKKRRQQCADTLNSYRRAKRDGKAILERASNHFSREIRTHTFKATMITDLLETGTPIHDVVSMGFHKTIQQTLEYNRQLKTTREIKKIMGSRFNLKKVKSALKTSKAEIKKQNLEEAKLKEEELKPKKRRAKRK